MTNRQDCRLGRPLVGRRVANKDVRHHIQWFEKHVGRAVTTRRFQLITAQTVGRKGEALAGNFRLKPCCVELSMVSRN